MKLLFLLLLGMVLNMSTVCANISYAPNAIAAVENTPPAEKQKVKKGKSPRQKKKRHPDHNQDNVKIIWSLILGFILLTISILLLILAVILYFALNTVLVGLYIFYLGLFFLALSLPFIIVGFVRIKNRGVREKKGSTNEGKATY